MGIRGRLSLGDISDDAQTEAAAHAGDFRVSRATAASVCSQDAFRSHVCPSSRGDGSDCESAADVNCRPLEEDLGNGGVAAGLWVYHDHRLRPKANRKSPPSGSVISSTVHSAVNVLH